MIWRSYRRGISSAQQQEQHVDLLSGRTGLGSLLDAAEKIAGDRFEKLALEAASAPVPVPQSLENRIATSIDDGVENTGRTRLALCRG
ncbi:hypothetical protein ABIB06_001398 [Bradyrhizobium sp. LB8.2]|uniref:hypothetical protein n=1 Tax=unclassified Bradyrhizobium TaxID=2631580 RepID=UPI0033907B6F